MFIGATFESDAAGSLAALADGETILYDLIGLRVSFGRRTTNV